MVASRGFRATDYALAALPVFGVAAALYVRTLLPDVGLWDTAEFQAIGSVLGTAHPTGYPTYTLLAWLASVVFTPLGNEAYRADLLSALFMAGAAALLALRATSATGRWPLGLVAGLAFALTPAAWAWGQRADPHALHALLAALLLVLLGLWQGRRSQGAERADRWLLVASAVYGLSLGNHALTLLLAPGIGVFVLLVAPRILREQLRLVLACAGVIALTAVLVHLYLPLRAAMDPPLSYAHPDTWDGFWYVVLGEQFRGSFEGLPPLADIVSSAWDELVAQFGPLSIAAGAGAALGLVRHPRLMALTLLWFGATWLFASGYANAAIERYYLVPLLVAALWVALTAELVLDLVGELLPPNRRRLRRWAAAGLSVLLLLLVLIPAADHLERLDRSNDSRGRDFLESAFSTLEEDAVVVSWWSYSTPLWYGQYVEGRRSDITVIDDRDILDDGYGTPAAAIDAHLGSRPVYVIRRDRDIEELAQHYDLAPVEGVPVELYRVVASRKAE